MATKPIKIKILGDAKGFNKALQQSEDDLGRFSKGVANISKKAVAAAKLAGVAAVAAGVKGVASFAKFEQQMNEVFTLLPGISEKAMDDMTGQVKDFSKEFGVLPDEVVPALYSALSAGVPQDNVFEFMKTAQMAAKGGVTELETAVDGISSVVNAYGEEIITATEASDYMFTAVRLGKTTFGELSAKISNVTPIANAVGVGFDEVAASLAVLTSAGVPTAQATTQVRAALAELAKSGSIADQAFQKLTGQAFTAFIESGGTMGEAFQIMTDGAADAGGSVVDMFGSIEAAQAVMSLGAEGGEAYADTLGEMQNAAGATEEAFDTMSKGLMDQFNKIKAAFAVLMIDIGEKLAPYVEKAIGIIRTAIGKMKDAWDKVRPSVQRFIDKAKKLAEKWLPKVRDWLQKVIDKVKKLAEEWLPKIRDLFQQVINRVKKLAEDWLPKIRDAIQQVIDKIKDLADTWLPKIRDALPTAFQWIIDNKDYIIAAVAGIGTAFLIYAIPSALLTAQYFLLVAASAAAAAASMIVAAAPAIALAALFAGLAAGAVWAYQNVEWFRDGVDKVAQWFKKDFLPTMRLVWDAVWQIVKHYIKMIEVVMRVYIAWAKLVWENFGKTIMGFVKTAWGAISTIIEGALKFIQGVIQIVTGIIKGDWSLVWNGIKNVFVGIWEGIKGALALALGVIETAIQVTLDAITLAWDLAWTAVQTAFSTAWELVETLVSAGLDWLLEQFIALPGAIGGVLTTLADGIIAPFRLAFNTIKTLWNNTIGGFGFTVPSWIPKVGGKGFKIPYIGGGGNAVGGGVTGPVDAFFANGGFVNGPTVAMIGEAGPELVLPLTRPARTQELLSEHGLTGGPSVTNINVTARTDADPDAIAQQVAWQIRVGGI